MMFSVMSDCALS